MNKRDFLKTSTVFTLGSIVTGKMASAIPGIESSQQNYELPDLPYAYDALQPYIDAQTMEIHHSKHHAGYTRKFNDALEKENLVGKTLKEVFANVSNHSSSIRNNGGGYYNHTLYWNVMSPNGGGKPSGKLLEAINSSFGSFEKFQKAFSTAAKTRFGSGWAWLVSTPDGLKVSSTPNQDNPLMDIAQVQGEPLLGIDVWEHAYYLKYQNKRADYVNAFWNVVNWDHVSSLFEK